jgi:hypothetical protein
MVKKGFCQVDLRFRYLPIGLRLTSLQQAALIMADIRHCQCAAAAEAE